MTPPSRHWGVFLIVVRAFQDLIGHNLDAFRTAARVRAGWGRIEFQFQHGDGFKVCIGDSVAWGKDVEGVVAVAVAAAAGEDVGVQVVVRGDLVGGLRGGFGGG